MSAAAEAPGALSHLRVLDLSQLVSGPYATKLLADYGADVVKVEPLEGDPARRLGRAVRGGPAGGSPLFIHLNTNKRSLAMDLRTRQGRAWLLEMLPSCHVLVENFAPGLLDAWGLTEATLVERNPRLVIVRITPYGQDGPYRSYAATDLTLQAASGMAHHNGDADREPLRVYGYQAYYLGGAHAAVATLGAVRRSRATASAQTVDVAVVTCGTNVIVPTHTSYAYDNRVTVRRGGGRGTFSVYPCADGFASISVYHTGREWPDFVEMTGVESLRDPKFATARGREENMEELEATILSWTLSKTKQELLDLGRKHRIAVGPETTMEELLASPPLRARAFFTQADHPVWGRFEQPSGPARLSEAPWRLRRSAPLLGEHTGEVLAEIGVSGEALARARALGVVGR